jgi:deferrochelatase/peroxidase EfeB
MAALPLAEIQGFILRGYGMDALRLFILRVESAAESRRLLGKLPVTDGAPWAQKPDFCLNVALTYEGLSALQLPPESLNSFPQEFVEGIVRRAEAIGDVDESAPANWKQPLAGAGVHIVLLLFAQNQNIIEAQSTELRALWAAGSATSEIFAIDGGVLPGDLAHFGYRDGFSQPAIEGGPVNPVPDILPAAPAGEFVLGYPSQFEQFTYPVPVPQELGLNGSFLALRILEQDCAGFERMQNEAPRKYGISGEKLAAKMCGRWRNGVPLSLSPDTDAPSEPIPPELLNSYDYVPTAEHPNIYDDSKGYRCPVGSHMRRNNPRSSTVAGGSGLKHRIVRRGLPYGPPYDPGHPDDGIERGLVGLFIGVSLKDQFEFLMTEWVNGDSFAAGITGTKDPLLGISGDGGGKMFIPVEGGNKLIVSGFSQFVRTRGAAYCFIPSFTALRYIADLR